MPSTYSRTVPWSSNMLSLNTRLARRLVTQPSAPALCSESFQFFMPTESSLKALGRYIFLVPQLDKPCSLWALVASHVSLVSPW